jgi:hypothetical protein
MGVSPGQKFQPVAHPQSFILILIPATQAATPLRISEVSVDDTEEKRAMHP